MRATENKHFTDIMCDNQSYYWIEESDDTNLVKIGESLKKKIGVTKKTVYTCTLVWRNRIGEHSAKKTKIEEADIDEIMHVRISAHYKLYTVWVNYATFCIIAHGKRISVFDLTNSDEKLLI
jgi:hypothetical protein